ncbi:hypothetical protein [Ilumatobacter coccineus]|uniref:Biopolymer transporter Tol n=1 Tax=Ilumatobacter coccineus (strain NBRC 103263 / KCTC 29153 / YM16-304) TaxID=1313172 RepID=A0A6C7EIC9_ILUCY|nr:hypothetical protein [Ilumatobacter coccineus]BAN04288.1 hypothetical protein YM304_39740 [Ilumatobacter coccineus YM16-304]
MTRWSEVRERAETDRVIAGRRWRVSDPALDDDLRTELVAGLMSARRAVKAALAADDDEALRRARDAVHDAKVALGERGPKWWEPTTPADDAFRLAAATRTLSARDGSDPAPAELRPRLGLPDEHA